MDDKKLYKSPQIEVHALALTDVVCASDEKKENNNLEWDWE